MLRRATLADVATIHSLTQAAYEKWLPVIGRKPLPMTADHELAVTQHIVTLYDENSETVGLVEVIPAEGFLLIESLAVLPNRQRRGIGDVLLAHAEGVATTLGLPEVRLYTNGLFAANLAFYGKRGYGAFAQVPHPAGGTVVHMRKRLGGN